MNDDIKLWHGDCLELMKDIPDKSVDCIICDLPFGTTTSSWDKIIDFKELWKQYLRIIKDDRAICLFGSGATGVACVNTNRKFIGIELDDNYYDIACKRVKEAIINKQLNLF